MPPRPTRSETIRFLTLDELGRLLAATRESVRDRALFLLAYRHGLRASEVGLLRGRPRPAYAAADGAPAQGQPLRHTPVASRRGQSDPGLAAREGAATLAGAVPQQPRRPDRPAHAGLADEEVRRGRGPAALQAALPLPQALHRHPPAGARRRLALRPGLAGARQHPEHCGLRPPDHARARGRGPARLPQPAPLLTGKGAGMGATTFDGTSWDLTPADRLLIEARRWGSRLRFAVMLLFFRARGRFPRAAAEVDEDAVAELARTLGVPAPPSGAPLLPEAADRTAERQRAEIRALLGFREATVADADELGAWLRDTVVARTRDMGELTAEAEARCRAFRLEPPTPDRVARIVGGAVRAYAERRHAAVQARLAPDARARLEALVRPPPG